MGFFFWIGLLVFVAFKAQSEAKNRKPITFFEKESLNQNRFWSFIVFLFLGYASLFYGVGLPTTGTSALAILSSSITVFLITYFLEKSNSNPTK